MSSQSQEPNKRAHGYLTWAIILSVASNVLLLVSPLYMIQVYDRVLTSGSQSTLLSLSLIAVFLLAIYGFAESGRRRALGIIGNKLAQRTTEWVARRSLIAKPSAATPQEQQASQADVARLESFLGSGGILPLLDLPFTPLFMALMFLLHPVIGLIGLGGACLLILIAVIAERATSPSMIENQRDEEQARRFLSELSSSRSAIIAMGLGERLVKSWTRHRTTASASKLKNSSKSGAFTSLTRSLRQCIQTLVLGVGAYFALQQEMSPGAIIAGSIVMGRALAPVDQLVGSWKQFSLARESWKKVQNLAGEDHGPTHTTEIKELSGRIEFQSVSIGLPSVEQPLLNPFSFVAEPGNVYGLISASGTGKTTFLQALAGVWPLKSGKILFDGRDIAVWPDQDRGRFVGYLPQAVELLPGTVAENIKRFDDSKPERAVEVAAGLGMHEVIMRIPNAYDAMIGEGGIGLSAGQRQAIGLARACYGRPPILIFDEPTSNMDSSMFQSFLNTLGTVKESGATVFLATHEHRILGHLDYVMSIHSGQLRVEPASVISERAKLAVLKKDATA